MTNDDVVLPRKRDRFTTGAIALIVAATLAAPSRAADAPKPSPEEVAFFETSIRPILVESCQKCHGPKKQQSGLRVDSREALLKGGDLGPAVTPGKPGESPLVKAVLHHEGDDLKMPPDKKLPDAAIQAIQKWVESGAAWGESAPVATADDPAKTHWAFQPLRRTPTPTVKDQGWVKTPIDARILAKLEQEGMTPSPSADHRTLIRRATFDLLGVPPTAAEIEAFEADHAPDAFARLVDRLLASPLYGERWGRHWLDVARYADTKGYVFTEDRRYPFAFTYRDYVIDAFNADLPFNTFIVQQLAADQLPLGDDPQPLAAMGFLTVGRRFLQDRNEIIDDRIDLVGRGLLGLTIACARCHDHKFDPIPTDDYYSLYGVFASSVEPNELPRVKGRTDDGSPEVKDLEQKLVQARKTRDEYKVARRAEVDDDLEARASKYLHAAYDLKFDGRSAGLQPRAAKDDLRPERIREVAFLWRKRLKATDAQNHPVLGPWLLFQALPKESFAAKSGEVVAELEKRSQAKPETVHPLLLAAIRDAKPADMDRLADCYVTLLTRLEERCRASFEQAKKKAPLAEPEWESLRAAFHGDKGLFALSGEDDDQFLLDIKQTEAFASLTNAVQELERAAAAKVCRAMVMNDAPKPMDPHVFVRGNPGRPGKPVPRQFLQVLTGADRKPFQKGSGRLELAEAIVGKAAPLTARVIVNRVWRWHFGQGLVDSPSDFGVRSDPPTHPELLDDLAAGFLAEGWSIKSLHRRIMLSSVYQQQSTLRPDYVAKDAQNRLAWRFNRQRLDFESLRDSMLAVAGSLDTTQGGPAVILNEAPFPPRRTVYGFIDRQNLDGVYRTFDFAVPDATSPKRFVTTVPQQALFLMNSPFVQDQAKRLATDLEREAQAAQPPADTTAVVARVYRQVLGRQPDDRERGRAQEFLQRAGGPAAAGMSPLAQLAQVLMLTNEFLFID
ncbi:MAG: PSD1 and planctomycete cytochrome C domain-containing protein [Paludisphaera borealis]|uniref:PSD1 and planctomycete cytochrome C domain-containing protein n=1 Tax=Paludisphaera borealis TaxID=1387353 RepID=UPI00284C92CA|nr:PSD1 and planctomycete cytochrome C domain-containing protein [Paludisphaera borealis]MDR3619947.1 PSD1 and planctomycete cytochrome C domain-containing protein [Paludisphaera borealis]